MRLRASDRLVTLFDRLLTAVSRRFCPAPSEARLALTSVSARSTLLIAQRSPSEAYRRVDFDARVSGASPQALLELCYETAITALGSALFAHERADIRARSGAITRALSAVTALQLGISGKDGVAGALHQFYEATRRALLDNALTFDPARIAMIRRDFADIAGAISVPAATSA